MKNKNPYCFLKGLCLFLVLFVLVSCDDLESVVLDGPTSIEKGNGGLYILCDGNYALNNSTLALYNFKNGTLNIDYFQTNNGRKLGDTGNDLQRYGSKLYAVVNGSSQIEVIDAETGESVRQIPLFDGSKGRQPRSVTFWEGKTYVCSFDGTVARIDTATLNVEAYVHVGRNPDGITVSHGKLYVSNSGGLDYASSLGYDNTVSVIDLSTFSENKRITVGLNPGKIKADIYGYVYVVSRGDYQSTSGVWQCIDANTDEVVATYDLSVTNFDFYGNLAYLYSYDNKNKESWIKVFNLRSGEVVQDSFIKDGAKITTPYGISVNPDNGDVFITDAGNYVSMGDVYCFSQDGLLKYKIANVGISPNTVLYVEDLAGKATDEVDSTVLDAKYLYHVLEYIPAPGQFVGTFPVYTDGATIENMRVMAEKQLKGKTGGLVSLGRYGGSLTFNFKNAVQNVADCNDLKIYGNAFANASEPGIVEVSVDRNLNGLADDVWYELAGSEYYKAGTTKNYHICYYRPSSPSDSVPYKDNQGRTGLVNAFYPAWQCDSIVWTGTLLAPIATQNSTGYWELHSLDWGYVDNLSEKSDPSGFDIDWAVDGDGHSIHLDSINFVRVYTGVNQNAGKIGELSTEITGAENLHP